MPNTAPAKYTVQLGPTVTPEVAADLAAWAELLEDSNSSITRESIERGLTALARGWRKVLVERFGDDAQAIWDEAYGRHLQHFQGRGTRQVSRRREYDRNSRSTPAA